MPSDVPQYISIDQEWASSLVRIRMRVPAHWWSGCSGNDESPGQIDGVNFSDDSQRYFLLDLDDEKGAQYPMRYDAISLYADKDAPILRN